MPQTRTFGDALLDKVMESLPNDFMDNNIATLLAPSKPIKKSLRKKIAHRLAPPEDSFPKWHVQLPTKNYETIKPLLPGLNELYQLLADDWSKELLVTLFAFRILGFNKVKTPVNNPFFLEKLNALQKIADKTNSVESGFMGWKLDRFDLLPLGLPIKLNYTLIPTLTTFFLEQYHYHHGDVDISVSNGDVVVDAGGCWADTALYFANRTGNNGKVYSFEFIPKNIHFFNNNVALNSNLAASIELVQQPLWDIASIPTYFIDNGPASRVSFNKMEGFEGVANTETIDNFVANRKLNKVDFIKMDIEGAELAALKGAEGTLIKYKPKLAIAIYHSVDDFVTIPAYINSLGLGYQLYLDHFTWNADETVLFAITDNND